MTHTGRLGTRLALAFSLVSLVTVILLMLAAQVAVNTGLQAVRGGGLTALAGELSDTAAQEYQAADGWAGADLAALEARAEEAAVSLTLTGADGTVVLELGTGRGQGATAVVRSGGAPVGSLTLRADGPTAAANAEARGRRLALTWMLGAGVVSLALALVAGWGVTRWLTRPLRDVAEVARAFARGDRSRRATPSGAAELADLANGFNEAAEAVDRNAAARRQMAADVAHELRTPLAALQAGLEELRDGLVTPTVPVLGALHAQAERLGRVVGDLAALSEAEDRAPDLVPGRTDLAAFTRAEIAAREPELRAAGVSVRKLRLDPVEVHADSDRIHQVVGNLLANCARHCRSGDHVDVAVHTDGRFGVVEVRDDGPGIAPEDLPRVAERYVRRPGSPGSGLGLAVAKEIVEAHRGHLEVTSAGGTTVVVRLPLE